MEHKIVKKTRWGNTMDVGRAVLVFAVLALILILPAGADSKQSVSLGGHMFTANLPDGWTTDTTIENATGPRWGSFYENDLGSIFEKNDWIEWTGQTMQNAFVSGDMSEADPTMPNGIVAIYVLKIPSDMPDRSNETLVLDNVSFLSNEYLQNDYLTHHDQVSIKDITYNNHNARLIEEDIGSTSFGAVSFKLDDNTVAIIDVDDDNGKAWDILDGMTIT